jgi:hypothetical protein
MSGSARSLEISCFSGLRVASMSYTPAHSKNGKNISAKLVVNAFMNIASKANAGEGRNEAVPFTIWGKLADICAKSMSPGKEFNCHAQLHVYMGRVFMPSLVPGTPGQQINDSTGQPVLTKKFSYTIDRLTFGEESNKHILNEIQAGVRPPDWNVAGTPGQAAWKAQLQTRQAIQFDPNLPTFGYARIYLPQGAGIGAYVQNQPIGAAVVAPVAGTAAAVAATFAGVQPASVVAQPVVAAAPVVMPGGFVVPNGV